MNLSLLLFLFFLVTFTIISVEARNHPIKKTKPHKHLKDKSGNGDTRDSNFPGPAPAPLPHHGSYPPQSSIFNILSFGAKGDGVSDDSEALLAAWKAACKFPGATIEIPSEFNFLIKPITLQGPCMPPLVLQIDGILLAPPKVGSWPKSSLFQWIDFKWVQNFTIQGTGTVDGQGSNWWSMSQIPYIQGMIVYPYKLVAPTSMFIILTVALDMGGIGSVKNVSFTNIQVSDVKVPVIIDQFYCDKGFCKNQTGAVAISGVKFDQIVGTYSVQPFHLACSNDIPCTDIDLIDIQLKPSPRYRGFQQGLCWNTYGKSRAPLVPSSIDYCLINKGGTVKRIARSHDNVC
uniref:Pectate lyase superfamily protein domain-containing protein n=1 Tax=Fagus sylvatica TaxID=28930 RepID=A0A2N9IQV6_FAGSY